MKKLSLQVLMIICGILAGINVFATVIGVLCLDPTLIVFYGIFAAIFIFANRKLAAKVKVIKAEAPKEKVKVEPVKDDVINLNNHKEEPKKEKPAKKRVTITDRINAKLDEWDKKLDKKIAEGTDENGVYHISEKTEKRAAFAGKVIGVLICIGMVVGGIALIVLLFNILGAVIAFLFDILFYVLGFIAAIFIIGGFLSFWWDLVKWEHVYKPRGYVRVRRRRR